MTMNHYSKTFEVNWSDVDANRHMRNSAYLDYTTHVRFSYASAQGFSWNRMIELQVGPVLFSEQLKYLHEVYLGETIRIDYTLAGLSPDGARWHVRHDVYKADDETVAVINAKGGWLDLEKRKLIVPQSGLENLLSNLPHTQNFSELPALKRQ